MSTKAIEVPVWLPSLPASATSSLHNFSEYLEIYAHHCLPSAYRGMVIVYACGHIFAFCLCLPYFSKQIRSGRFWLVRLITTKRGRIIVPNHLDAAATLIGAYTLYDIGYCIKLILAYYQRTSQHNLMIILCMRFIILTNICWIFLLGFLLVKYPPNTFKVPAYVWNIGIFALPGAVIFGTAFCLRQLATYRNRFWAGYLKLRPIVDTALASGLTTPSADMIARARIMLGVNLHKCSWWILYWATPYAVWALFFATAILTVTLSILISHSKELKEDKDPLPMQSVPMLGFSRSGELRSGSSMTASMGIRKWVRELPTVPEERGQTATLLTIASGDPVKSEGTENVLLQRAHHSASERKVPPRTASSGPSFAKLALYGLGLRPLARDAYNDPSGGFSERKARAGLRTLLIHTATQGGCSFLVALTQIAACLVMVHPLYLQPLAAKGDAVAWGAKWVRLDSILRILEFYGAAIPGIGLIVSILMRQMQSIGISQAREARGLPLQMHRTGEDFALSAPGPSASAQWDDQQRSTREDSSQFVVSNPGRLDGIDELDKTKPGRPGDVDESDRNSRDKNMSRSGVTGSQTYRADSSSSFDVVHRLKSSDRNVKEASGLGWGAPAPAHPVQPVSIGRWALPTTLSPIDLGSTSDTGLFKSDELDDDSIFNLRWLVMAVSYPITLASFKSWSASACASLAFHHHH
ncbi:hypothetical protein V8E36_005730 [Tilletia maclaganii]